MALTLKMTEDTEHIEKQQKCLDFLRENQVDVGLTSHASGWSVFLLGIHTRGSPIMRIPPRPVVDPALAKESLKTEMGEHLLESCEAAFDGDMSGTVAGMEDCGQRGADGIREYIDGGIGPPNAPVTLSGGWIYNRVAKKGVPLSPWSGSPTPGHVRERHREVRPRKPWAVFIQERRKCSSCCRRRNEKSTATMTSPTPTGRRTKPCRCSAP